MRKQTILPMIMVLPTAMVRLEINNVKIGPVRALCDGGSQPNLIRQNVLAKHGFRGYPLNKGIYGITGDAIKIRTQLKVKIYPWFESSDYVEVIFWVLPKSSNWDIALPDRIILPEEVKLSDRINMADPLFWSKGKIQLLLGIGVWAKVIKSNVSPVSKELVQQETTFGSVIMGSTGSDPSMLPNGTFAVKECDSKEIERLLKKLWELDQVPERPSKSKEQQLVEGIFREKRTVDSNGRYAVPIILQPNVKEIGSSRLTALRRFHILEKRFKREPEYHNAYVAFMREYEQLGHMKEAPSDDSNEMKYYIPHHGIFSSSSFKVVFDCSCKTDKGKSLNDMQLKGQKLQRDLPDILLRSRRFKYGLSVDVKKMYRQIEIIPEHYNLQRIFWREKSSDPLKEFYLVTVIYGQTSSPINAIMVMHEGAEKMREIYPRAVEFIKQDFYMDDGFSGADSEEEVIELSQHLEKVFARMMFFLDKWKSNSQALMLYVNGTETSVFFEEIEKQTILGMKWDLITDEFTYMLKKSDDPKKWTRRSVLSKVASIYDPLGHVEPVTLIAKSFMQELWRKTKTWDVEVPSDFVKNWIDFWEKIKLIHNVKVPRWTGAAKDVKLQLHGFSDASEKGIGVVIYVRAQSPNGDVRITQLIAKSKVAPLKVVAMPRLELSAATLLAKVMKHVRNCMEWEKVPYFLRTDSTVTLQWIRKEPCELKLFVGNRVSNIQENSEISAWSHIRSEDNPADIASRGLMPNEIASCELWWQGPPWLKLPMEKWPQQTNVVFNEMDIESEMKVHTATVKNRIVRLATENGNVVPLIDYSNNLNKILLIHCYVMRFVKGFIRKMEMKRNGECENRTRSKVKRKQLILLPSNEEKEEAMRCLVREEQALEYAKELKGNFKTSDIKSLRPFRDDEGILRVGGRLKHAACPYELKVPMIIPPNSRLSWLVINGAHQTLDHGHIQVMMQYLRMKYWIPRLRSELRSFVNKCVTCKRYEHPLEKQLMGDLPKERTTPCKPFTYTGVDYAGPIEIKEYLKTRTNKRKCWIAIFTCLVTRAMHIDIVTDLTSAAYIECFRRFVGRRGECVKLFSDNATTFVGASKELKVAFEKWNTEETHKKLIHLVLYGDL